jgi:hypothetical protein
MQLKFVPQNPIMKKKQNINPMLATSSKLNIESMFLDGGTGSGAASTTGKKS